ncbi:calcium/sodium antiporter [uncultured Ruminococcus sp.]|uniref:calcium/sodium antiporter n=1 Tax=uncultured Ruminococcus sp. TaxID=165186 RepID=UPI0029309086|nr:calcium/sodium antiporter [uncultured Ruminococcus sp.]
MQMVLQIVLLIAGFVALIKGADLFVDGSSSLAAIFKVPSIIIGLTIVAMGTSAPELAVSTSAAINGSNEIAVSNVVGSNLFNLLMVLGICALIKPLPLDNVIKKRDFPFSIIITIALFVALGVGVLKSTEFATVKMGDNVTTLERWMGIALIAIFVVYIIVLIRSALKNKTEGEAVKQMSPLKSVLFVLIGIALIVAGGHFVVESAKYIAAAFGMSETLIGLTIVAVGTSLPELVTSVVASRKGENGLAVGNVVGSNIFNILLILGVSGTIHPIRVNFASMIDIAILIAVSILVFIFALRNKINRPQGAVMILIYIATMVFAIVR